ncbi:OX-2 membrane glycoprotein-like [Trichomycterus rosablanca]|uniref:OX-2 membrane glycoprotein-like n=1 Tax=Trichomycterus rosablanca TaxID=2290929 RepID=UPI002F35F14D
MLEYLFFSSLLLSAHSEGIVVTGGGNVFLGDNATLTCTLSGAVGVRQVTWHQSGRDDEDPATRVVTFSEHSEYKVADSHVGKVDVTVASLNTTTILIKNVQFGDESCYICTFNVYPSGTERKKTCLTVQGISEITSNISYKEKDVTAYCSATGNPVPVFTWNSSKEELSQYVTNNFTVKNEDGTTKTTSELRLPLEKFHKDYVECVGQSGSLTSSKIMYLDTGKDSDNGGTVESRHYVASAVVICFLFVACCIVVLFHRRRKHGKENIEIA